MQAAVDAGGAVVEAEVESPLHPGDVSLRCGTGPNSTSTRV